MKNICLDCALCCDGTIHSTVTLGESDRVDALVASGVRLYEVDGKRTFELPCAAGGGGCCSIYDRRPAICREASCALRRRYDAGLVSFDDARSLIESVIEMRDRVRPELERFFGTPGPHSIAELYGLLHSTVGGKESPLRSRHEHAELLLDVTALRRLVVRHFENGRPDSHAPAGSATSD